MQCHELDEETHAVLERASTRVHPKSGKSRTTITNIARDLGLDHRDVSDLLADLEGHGFIEVDRSQGWIYVFAGCSCSTMLDTPGGSAVVPARAGTHAQTSPPSPTPYSSSPPTGGSRGLGGDVRAARNFRQAEFAPIASKNQNSSELGESNESSPVRVVGRRRKRKQGPGPDSMQPHDLAEHFRRSVLRMKSRYRIGWVGGFNDAALRAHFRRWRDEDGITPREIHEMIEIFTTAKFEPKGGISIWKVFLADRQRLLEMARRSLTGSATLDADEDDPLGWGPEAPTDDDPLGWD